MSDLIMSTLKTIVVNYATTEGEEGIVNVVNSLADNDEDIDNALNNIPDEDGDSKKSWWERLLGLVGGGLATIWNNFSTPALLSKAKAFICRLLGDNVENFYNFNWNVSDADLDAQFANTVHQIAGQLGGTLGGLFGGLVCGGSVVLADIAIAKMIKFNDGTAVKVLNEVGEEALDELYDNLRALGMTVQRAALQWTFVQLYKGGRRALKWLLQDPDSFQSKAVKKIWGNGLYNGIKESGNKGSKPWSFALADEKKWDAMGETALREYSEEYAEEFREACQQAFYIAASVYEQHAVEPNMLLGQERVVEIYPDREDKSNKIILAGNESILVPQIIQTIQQERRFQKYNIGMIIGEALETKIANLKGIDSKQVDMIITYYNHEEPPFVRKNKKNEKFTVRIPDVNRAKADDWDLIKSLVGGKNGYLAGGIKVIASLGKSDGLEVDTIEVMAATENEGMNLIEDMLKLTDLLVLRYQLINQTKKGTKGVWFWIDPIKVYPAHFTFINYERIIKEQEGKKPPSGTYKKDKYLFPLWVKEKPQDYNETVNQLLRENA